MSRRARVMALSAAIIAVAGLSSLSAEEALVRMCGATNSCGYCLYEPFDEQDVTNACIGEGCTEYCEWEHNECCQDGINLIECVPGYSP
jgi:hypothetical protein